ncbi:hypothetical protein LTR36_004818 [Oleoguttula mirabilis]|uniref:Uncharacterized protein n=1 Tax=Oleoguttula mirabilis TaxID=1507867 RepID=A0AAV9JEP5_9PEZI|nr:hypothetical protein LTR36_004818 [Oleoguttula mirabilis]
MPLQQTLCFGSNDLDEEGFRKDLTLNPLLTKLITEDHDTFIITDCGAWTVRAFTVHASRSVLDMCGTFYSHGSMKAYLRLDFHKEPVPESGRSMHVYRSQFLDYMYICQPAKPIAVSAWPSEQSPLEREQRPSENVLVEAGSTFGDVLDAVVAKVGMKGWDKHDGRPQRVVSH